MRLFNRVAACVCMAVLFTPASVAYIRRIFVYADGSTFPSRRTDNAGIQFYVNSKIGPNFQSSASGQQVTVISAGSDPVGAIQAALAAWNGIPGANLRFLALKATDKVADRTDGQMTIVVGSTASDLSMVGGALAVTVNESAAFTLGNPSSGGIIADSDIIINPTYAFSTDFSTSNDLQGVMTHEFGHALGLAHSGLLGAVMFQSAGFSARYLSADETAFAAATYPGSGNALGTVTGKVVAADGSPVQSGLVTLLDTAAGTSLSALTGADGSYSLMAIPGNYVIYADAVGAGSLVQPANLFLSAGAIVTTTFQPTMLGGFSSPSKVAVTAGSTTSAPNLAVTAGISALSWPYIGSGTAGGIGGSVSVAPAAVVVPSGQAIDLILIGGGVDGTIGVQAFGRAITVRPGTVRVDPNLRFGGSLTGMPLVRVTVDVATVDSPSLASLILTKGQNVFAVSGAFVVVPPKPTFISGGVVSAASGQYVGAVSPGGISSIYDIPGAPNLGPLSFVANAPNYDAYGKLPASLAGLTVTFDGVPAPLFLSWGQQVNFQVPFEVAGKTSTKVVVNYLGSLSDPVIVPVVATQPAFFMLSATDPFAANSDYVANPRPNSASNPASRGSVISVYGTGVGKASYDIATGVGAPGPPAGFTGGYSCALGGKSMPVPFAGWTPTSVGLSQWSFVIPADAATGAVSLKCTDSVSGASTPSATIYIK